MWTNIVLVLLGILVLALLWIAIYDSTHFVITDYRVTDPRIRKKCRAVVIADLHNKKFGRDNGILLGAISENKPDFVLIAGDIMTAKPKADLAPALEFIGELAKDYPIYYGVGNHEHRMKLYSKVYGDMPQRYEAGLAAVGVEEMVNRRALLEEYGITITGAQIHERFYKRMKNTTMDEEYLHSILGDVDKETYQVLLAHNPDYFPEYAAWGADLTLSGHVHGGVIRIPFWNKGLISPAVRFFPKYDGGLYFEGRAAMLLSRGLGIHTIPFRLFNPGDLIFVDFCPGETSEVIKQSEKK